MIFAFIAQYDRSVDTSLLRIGVPAGVGEIAVHDNVMRGYDDRPDAIRGGYSVYPGEILRREIAIPTEVQS